MRNAPSVSYPVGRSRFGVRMMLCGWAAALALLLAWVVLVPAHPGRQAAVGVLLAAWAVLAWFGERRTRQGELLWDGGTWWLNQGEVSRAIRPEVVLDLQRVLLLRLEDTAGTGARVQWRWVEARSERSAWLALRRALYSRARTDAPPSRGDEAALP